MMALIARSWAETTMVWTGGPACSIPIREGPPLEEGELGSSSLKQCKDTDTETDNTQHTLPSKFIQPLCNDLYH